MTRVEVGRKDMGIYNLMEDMALDGVDLWCMICVTDTK